jgi:hypothetical protein
MAERENARSGDLRPFPVRTHTEQSSATDNGAETEESETRYREFLDRKKVYPLHFVEGADGGIAALVIHEDWYDVLKPLYDYFRGISGVVSVTDIPEQVRSILEGLGQFIPEYGFQGWLFTFSILGALQLAAKRTLDIGTFHYERTAIYSPRTAGEVGYGKLTLVPDLDS